MPHEIRTDATLVQEQRKIASFNDSPFARLLSMTITEAHDGYARVVMDCPDTKNPHDVAHGGAIFALADQAFGIAANCSYASRVAVSVHIQYIAPATGPLVAIAHRVADNGKYSTFRVMVYEGERIIAEFDGVALLVNSSLQ
ncbi:MAG: PaaI family thioesterase [Methanoregula sp.]|nr:PaaI family thioesterase [Methanoregula sp.]